MRTQIRSDRANSNRLRAAFSREEPNCVPAMETGIYPELNTSFMGGPAENLLEEVTFLMEAGYDSVTLDAWMFLPGERPQFTMQVDLEGRLQFSTAVKGLIQTWDD